MTDSAGGFRFAVEAASVASSTDAVGRYDLVDATSAAACLAFMSQASRVLASSLDGMATLASLIRLVVPRLADWCSIELCQELGTSQRWISAHRDPAQEGVLADLCRHQPFDPDAAHPVAVAMRQGRPILIPEMTETHMATAALDQGAYEAVRSLAPRSMMLVPMTIHGRLLGMMSLSVGHGQPAYRPADLALAEELAARTAMALDNARLYGEAKEAVRDREEFIAMVSHDLKNPLSVIGTSALIVEMAASTHDTGHVLQRQAEIIRRSVGQMTHLINDLLDLASIEAGRLRVVPVCLEVPTVIADARDLLQPLAERHALYLRCDSSFAGFLPVLADRVRIQQVFSNLVGNAVKFTTPHGTIVLAAEPDGEFVRFTVSDTGVGIPDDQLDRIFDRYWQGRRHAPKGTGLGLSIARGIVEAQGGRLWVTSRENVGSTFYFTVPVATPVHG